MPASPITAAASGSHSRTQPAIITIGSGPVFLPVITWLQTNCPDCRLRHFNSLQQVMTALESDQTLPDLAVVFRTWCDEHPQLLVQQFIGRLFFRRIICCEGPLCSSEARTHQLWPASSRTTVAAAPARITHHLNELRAGRPPLSPLAAPEDVFAREVATAAALTSETTANRRVVVMVADAVLRQTIVQLLEDIHNRAEVANFNDLPQLLANSPSQPDWMVVDADEQHNCDDLLRQVQSRGSRMVAVSGFPAASPPEWATDLLDKTELPLQLATLLLPVTGRRI
ncbi:MAG: hypothetical protein RLZZ436_4591 [Planctomycetota bacterium]